MKLIDADKTNSKLLDLITQNDTAIAYAIKHKDRTLLEGIFFEYFEAQETAYDVDKVVDIVREDCYSMGFDESQTEIIVEDIRKGGI